MLIFSSRLHSTITMSRRMFFGATLAILLYLFNAVVSFSSQTPPPPNRRQESLHVGRDPLLSLNLNLDALTKAAATDRALELYSRINALYDEGYYATAPDIVSFNTVLNGFREDPAGALAFWEREMGARGDRLKPNTRSYTIIILALARAGLHSECLEILRLMQDNKTHVWPDRITYNAVLYSYASSTDPEAPRLAEMLLTEMIDASHQQDNSTGMAQGISPDAISFNSVITCWTQKGEAARAQAWLQRMREEGLRPDVYTYTLVMQAWAESGEVDKVLELLEEMNAQPSAKSFPNRITYTALVTAMGKKGRMKEAHDIVDSMWESPSESQPDLITYSVLLDGWSRVAFKRPDEAIDAVGRILQEMRQRADQGLEPNEITYTKALKVFADARSPLAIVRAHELVASMKDADTFHYNALLNIYSKSNRKDKIRLCLDTFRAMKKMGGRASPDRVTFHTLLQTFSNVYGDEKFKHSALVEGLKAYKEFDTLAQKLLQEVNGQEKAVNKYLPSSMTYSFLVRLVRRCGVMVSPDEKRRLFQRILNACGPKYGCLNLAVWEQLLISSDPLAKIQGLSVEEYLGLNELAGKDLGRNVDFAELPADWSRRALQDKRNQYWKSEQKR